MEPPSSPTRPGTPGLDVFKIAGHSISGFVHSFKTGDPRRVRQPFTSRLEEQLSMFLEYHPHVRFYQRGDASPACANTYGLVTELGTPYRINYLFDGKPHEYLPDYVGMLCDGGLLIAEAGRESEKSKGKALVKAEAARRLALLKGGVYWLGTETHLPERRHQNWLYLHARRQSFPTYQEIAETLLADFAWREMSTVHELVQRFGSRWSETEVEAAVWKLVGEAAAEGRLLVDLTEVELSRPRKNLHLRASQTGVGRPAGHYDRASTVLRSIGERDSRSLVYLGDAQVYPSSPWNHESQPSRSRSL